MVDSGFEGRMAERDWAIHDALKMAGRLHPLDVPRFLGLWSADLRDRSGIDASIGIDVCGIQADAIGHAADVIDANLEI